MLLADGEPRFPNLSCRTVGNQRAAQQQIVADFSQLLPKVVWELKKQLVFGVSEMYRNQKKRQSWKHFQRLKTHKH